MWTLSYDPQARALSYEADGLPRFVTRAVSHWSVHAVDGGGCTIHVYATLNLNPLLRPFGPAIRWRMRIDSAAVLGELAHRLQTGTPHPRKIAAAADNATTVL